MAQVGQVAISSEIPTVLKPFYEGIGKPGEAGYEPGLIERGVSAIFPGDLSGERAFLSRYAPVIGAGLMGAGEVAPMSQFQQQVGQSLGTLTAPDQYSLGTQAGQESAAGLQALMGLQAPGIGPARQFTGAEVSAYMSPYMQSVVDAQQRAAIDAAKRAQLGGGLAAARQGTYGGARQALLQGEREAGLRTQLGDIQARGLQEAFGQAQQAFQADRAAQTEIARANQAAALQAGQTRLGAAQGLGGLAQTFGGLGTQQLAGELDILKTQGAFGDLQRSIAQQQLDAQRAALMQQAEYGQTQVGQLSNLLRGIPLSDTTQRTTTPPPSFASQLTGLGLTGIGLYNLLGGGK